MVDQSRKKSKAPKPPSTEIQSDNNEIKDISNSSSIGKSNENQKLKKSDIENCNVTINDNLVQTERNVDNDGMEKYKHVESSKQENIQEQDERFSPEKENALQTLDAVIQEVENSLSKYFDITFHTIPLPNPQKYMVQNFQMYTFLVLGCEEDNSSIDEDDINRPNAIDDKTVMEQESSDYDHDTDIRESNTNKISIPSTKSSQKNTNERLNDDIRIIDLESRGEESVSSYGRSTSDSPNPNFSPIITNGIPSNSASFTDQERETASPLSDNSSTNSPTESPPR